MKQYTTKELDAIATEFLLDNGYEEALNIYKKSPDRSGGGLTDAILFGREYVDDRTEEEEYFDSVAFFSKI